MNNVQMPKNLYVLCMDNRNYPPLPKLVSKCSLRSTSLKLEKNPISCATNMDGSSLPPCYPVILQKLRRTNYVCSVWLNAHKASIPKFLSSECGWVIQDDCYRLKWYDGEVEDICHDDSENDICCSGLKG